MKYSLTGLYYYLKLASNTENNIYFSILHEILPNILLLYSEHLTPSADPSDNNKDTKEIALLSPTKRRNSTNSLGIKLNLLHDQGILCIFFELYNTPNDLYHKLGKREEWRILGDLADKAKRNQGMERLFQEKVIKPFLFFII